MRRVRHKPGGTLGGDVPLILMRPDFYKRSEQARIRHHRRRARYLLVALLLATGLAGTLFYLWRG